MLENRRAFAEQRRQEAFLAPLGFTCCYCGKAIAPDDLAGGYGTGAPPRHKGLRACPVEAPRLLTDAEITECQRIAAARPTRPCSVGDAPACIGRGEARAA